MKLYYAPGACSLSNRISLHEAGLDFSYEAVDLHSKVTETGRDFVALNPKGYVPLLVLDDGQSVTENIAVLSLIADLAPQLLPDIPLGRIRMLEMLSFISSEIHIAFKPFFHAEPAPQRARAGRRITALFLLTADELSGDYLYGDRFTPADAYLFVMLLWAMRFEIRIPATLIPYFDRIIIRASVRRSLLEEDWTSPHGLGQSKCTSR